MGACIGGGGRATGWPSPGQPPPPNPPGGPHKHMAAGVSLSTRGAEKRCWKLAGSSPPWGGGESGWLLLGWTQLVSENQLRNNMAAKILRWNPITPQKTPFPKHSTAFPTYCVLIISFSPVPLYVGSFFGTGSAAWLRAAGKKKGAGWTAQEVVPSGLKKRGARPRACGGRRGCGRWR